MKTVIEMAREAGAGEPESLYGRTDYVVMTRFELERCAELVRADEREACLQIADQCADADMHASMAANAIRARTSS